MRTRRVTDMLRAPCTKELGGIKLTFEALEQLLEMKLNSIQGVEVDLMTQSIIIIHNDSGREGCHGVMPGGTLQTWQPPLHYIARMPPHSLVTDMLRAPCTKELGGIKLTFEALEQLLEMKLNSIQGVEVDLMTQSIIIIHNDSGREGCHGVMPGGTLQTWQPPLHYIARMPPRKEKI